MKMAKDDPIYVAGLSVNEHPTAEIWQFIGESPVKRVKHVRISELTRKGDDLSELPKRITGCINFLHETICGYEFDISAIGISIPGNIDRKKYIVQNCERLGITREVDFRKIEGRDINFKITPINIKDDCSIKNNLSIDNDVTCMTVAEYALNYKDAFENFVCIYIDDGVNIGAIVDGKVIHGALHPEVGHYRARTTRMPESNMRRLEPEERFCKLHEDCFEGILARRAVEKLWPGSFSDILNGRGKFHAHHEFLADCISQLCEIATLTFSPEKIVILGYVFDNLVASAIRRFNANTSGYPVYAERQAANFIVKGKATPVELFPLGAAIMAATEVQNGGGN